MPLREDLSKLRAKDLSDSRINAAYQAVIGQLTGAESANQALRVGDTMPPFVLPNAEGRLVVSDQLLGRGALVITFFRGNWCPYCRLTLRALETALARIHAAGGRLVALTPDTGTHLAKTKHHFNLAYEILSDVDGAVGLQFGVLFRAPEAYRELLTGLGVDLAESHGNDSWFIPMPASFVVDHKGIVRYAFVNADFTLRADPEEIIKALEALKVEKP
jgi:peroxiredoxin